MLLKIHFSLPNEQLQEAELRTLNKDKEHRRNALAVARFLFTFFSLSLFPEDCISFVLIEITQNLKEPKKLPKSVSHNVLSS